MEQQHSNDQQDDSIVLTAETIEAFTTAFLLAKFDNPVATPAFHRTLWELMCSDHDKVAIAAPRGHAKSTAVTHSFVLANLCFRKSTHILIVSDTESQASDFLGDIAMELVENELLRDTFGIKDLYKHTSTEIRGLFTDDSRFRILAKGSEQKLRGLKWRHQRPNLIVCDDLENDEIVMNEERRRKFQGWFLNALAPCGGDFAKIRVVGTILHLDSLLENLMPPLNHPATIVEELVQWFDEDKARLIALEAKERYVPRPWHAVRFRAHNEDFSEILWPQKFSKERLIRIRQDYINQGFPEGYSQEYLNYPIDEDNALFKAKDFREITEKQEPENYYISADLAISEKDQRAYTVFAVCSVNHRGMMKIREIVRFRGDSLEIIDEMFRLNFIYEPECFFVEEENIARTLGPVLNKEMNSRNQYFIIEMMKPQHDKVKRARPLQARVRAGMVEWDMESHWFPQCQQELTQFPRSKYMDQVDALAWLAVGLDKITEAPTKAEYIDEMYEKEMEDTYGSINLGVNQYTGY